MSKPYKDMTVEELWKEYNYWYTKIKEATGWGAALAAADEFRRDCARHLALRGVPLSEDTSR